MYEKLWISWRGEGKDKISKQMGELIIAFSFVKSSNVVTFCLKNCFQYSLVVLKIHIKYVYYWMICPIPSSPIGRQLIVIIRICYLTWEMVFVTKDTAFAVTSCGNRDTQKKNYRTLLTSWGLQGEFSYLGSLCYWCDLLKHCCCFLINPWHIVNQTYVYNSIMHRCFLLEVLQCCLVALTLYSTFLLSLSSSLADCNMGCK
jgi:hypothetical protein